MLVQKAPSKIAFVRLALVKRTDSKSAYLRSAPVKLVLDKLAEKKPRNTVIPFEERIQVVRACKYVDVAIPQIAQNKFEVWQKLKYNILFVGDDWYKTESWQEIEKKLAKNEVKIIYFPYTHGTSSTIINNTIDQLRIDFSKKK